MNTSKSVFRYTGPMPQKGRCCAGNLRGRKRQDHAVLDRGLRVQHGPRCRLAKRPAQLAQAAALSSRADDANYKSRRSPPPRRQSQASQPPLTTPFPAQYLYRRPSLLLRTSISTPIWTPLTRSHRLPAGGLTRSAAYYRVLTCLR